MAHKSNKMTIKLSHKDMHPTLRRQDSVIPTGSRVHVDRKREAKNGRVKHKLDQY